MVESAEEQRTIGIPVSTVSKNFFFTSMDFKESLCQKKIPRLAVSVVLSLLVHFPLVLHNTGEKANAYMLLLLHDHVILNQPTITNQF